MRFREIDDTTGALITMDTLHAEVHAGNMYHADYRFGSVANDGTARMVFTSGTLQPNFLFDVVAGGACTVGLYEGSTSTGGTAVTAYNMNRLSSGSALASIVHTPSAGTAGSVQLVNRYLPGGSMVLTRTGATLRPQVEYLLGTSTKYILDVVNVSGGAVQVGIAFEWYEE